MKKQETYARTVIMNFKFPRKCFPSRIIYLWRQTLLGPPILPCNELPWADWCFPVWHLQIFVKGLSLVEGTNLQVGSSRHLTLLGEALSLCLMGFFWLITLIEIIWGLYLSNSLAEVLTCSSGNLHINTHGALPTRASWEYLPNKLLEVNAFSQAPSLRYKSNYENSIKKV